MWDISHTVANYDPQAKLKCDFNGKSLMLHVITNSLSKTHVHLAAIECNITLLHW